MKLLKESANHTLNLLEMSVNDKTLGSPVALHRIDASIKIANSIANQLQVQNNLLKSLALFTKK